MGKWENGKMGKNNLSSLIQITEKNRISLPKTSMDFLHLEEGDYIILKIFPVERAIEIRKTNIKVDYPTNLEALIMTQKGYEKRDYAMK